MQDRIESLARELNGILGEYPDSFCDVDKSYPDNPLLCLARHVLIREMKARIDSLEKLPCGLFDSRPYRDNSIETITATLKELEYNNAPTQ